MKKLLLLIGLMLFSFTAMQAQGHFKIGVNGGIPVGDADDFTTFQLGADVAYMFDVADMFQVGPLAGYSVFFGDTYDLMGVSVDYDDVQFIPVAASGRLGLTDSFFLGADLGYAIGVNDGNDGGFYYRPQVGYDFGVVGLMLSYSGVAVDGGTFSSINFGVEFGL